MGSHNFSVVREEIKKVLKTRKVRYSKLAWELGVSESGVKKMLTAHDLSFNRIQKILAAANVSVSDFFRSLDEGRPFERKLTPKQEEHFLRHPEHYHFFHQLLDLGLSWRKLAKRHDLSQKGVERYLLALDKIGVLELKPGMVVKSEFENCRLSFSLALTKKVVDQKHRALLDFAHIPNDRFRGRKYVANGILRMRPETAGEFIRDLKALTDSYMKRSEREGLTAEEKSLEEIGFLLLVTPTAGMPFEKVPEFG